MPTTRHAESRLITLDCLLAKPREIFGPMLSRTIRLLALVGLLGCLGADPGVGPEPAAREGRPILFIGNSLTYVNDLPLIVEALADSVPGLTPAERLAPAMAAFPDYALEDHWANGTAVRAIDQGKWSVVILQQGSSALDESRVNLREWTKKFDERIRAVGARTAMYAVWPLASRQFDFERVNESYTLAATDVNGMLFPVGEAWLAAWRRNANLDLYAPDGLHPSVYGSYIGALVITSMLLDRSPIGMPVRVSLRSGTTVTIPAADAAVLQESASEAIAQFGRR
ncbi:MAG TPA: hypothetical protein VL308_18540 [Gemmatimonadaceae bacterium]|nr:hypothetical protein [Gemmatimonadaceae bacterium]